MAFSKKEYDHKYYLEHKEKKYAQAKARRIAKWDRVLEKARLWRENNRVHYNELGRKRYWANHEKKLLSGAKYREQNREKIREKDKASVKELTNAYVKQKILGKNRVSLGAKDIPMDLIEIKRLQLQLKREAKNANKITQ